MVLVTGGAGLVGAELIARLVEQGEKVRALYNRSKLPFGNEIEQINCNILDVMGLQEAMQDVGQVYHCAAIVSFSPARKAEMFKVNVEGTANVVNAALDNGVQKLVHVSSVAALGRIRNEEPINETMNWSEETSNSNYGKSKFLAEMEVWRGMAEGLEAVMVNPTIILGKANWNEGSTKLFQSAFNEFPWYADGTTGVVDVKDVARAMINLMQSTVTGERFILSAETLSYRAILTQIAECFGKKPPHKRVTPFISGLVWRMDAIRSLFTRKEPLITRETAKTALTKASFDNSKLKRFLPDWNYSPVGDTIARVCNELKEFYKL